MYVQQSHFAVHVKLTQLCKSTIPPTKIFLKTFKNQETIYFINPQSLCIHLKTSHSTDIWHPIMC